MDLRVEIIPSESRPKDEKYEKLPNKELLPKAPFYGAVVGAVGTGKSSILWTIVNKLFKNYWDYILVYNGVKDADKTWKSLENKDTKVDVLNQFNDDEFRTFIKKLEDTQMRRERKGKRFLNVIVVFDDAITQGMSKKHSIGVLDTAIQNRRHMNLSLLQSSQVYHQLNKSHRSLNTDFVIITQVNKKDAQSVAEEHSSGIDPDVLVELMKHVNKKRFDFFMIDYKQDIDKRFRKNFDVILKVKTDSDEETDNEFTEEEDE